jgi:flagellar biogenesis protein FliO
MYRVTRGVPSCILIAFGSALAPGALAHQTGPLRISGPVSVEVDPTRADHSDLLSADAQLPFPAFRSTVANSVPHEWFSEELPASTGSDELPAAETDPDHRNSVAPDPKPVSPSPDPETEAAPEPDTIQTPELAEREHLPLGKTAPAARSQSDGGSPRNSGMLGIARTAGATALVIGLILLLRFAFVKVSGATGGLRAQLGPSGKAPSGVLFVLGRYPVSRGMSLVLLQLDQRVLLLSQTGSGFHTLAELTDPEEVSMIIRKSRDENGDSLSAKFTGMLKKFESDPETIQDLESSAESRPVRLRFEGRDEQRLGSDYSGSQGYFEAKPSQPAPTGEDELRSRINRLREYGA